MNSYRENKEVKMVNGNLTVESGKDKDWAVRKMRSQKQQRPITLLCNIAEKSNDRPRAGAPGQQRFHCRKVSSQLPGHAQTQPISGRV
jgi:hypothetical protein